MKGVVSRLHGTTMKQDPPRIEIAIMDVMAAKKGGEFGFNLYVASEVHCMFEIYDLVSADHFVE
jgi:hypothetical protein